MPCVKYSDVQTSTNHVIQPQTYTAHSQHATQLLSYSFPAQVAIDVEIATLPKIASRSKSRFCLPQLSIFSSIFIKTLFYTDVNVKPEAKQREM